MSGPKTIYFYATSHCNSNCSYCVFRKSNLLLPRVHMPLEDVQRFWNESMCLNGAGVVLQGGEFTEHPQALEIAKFIRTKSPKVTLLTNAVRSDASYDLLPYVDQVTISLDGPKHDLSRGVPGNLASIINFLNARPFGNIVNLQITLGPWNMTESAVSWFMDRCEDWDVGMRFNVAEDIGLLGNGSYEVNHEKLSKVTDIIAERLGEDSLTVKYLRTVASGNRPRCMSTDVYSTIMPSGDVLMCQGLPEDEAKIGNLYEQPYDVLWYNAYTKRETYRTCKKCVLSCQLMGDIKYFGGK